MAISYENVIYDRVIESLSSIIADEFSIPIHYDAHEGNQSFLITPVSDELEDSLTSGQTRNCEVEISYQLACITMMRKIFGWLLLQRFP